MLYNQHQPRKNLAGMHFAAQMLRFIDNLPWKEVIVVDDHGPESENSWNGDDTPTREINVVVPPKPKPVATPASEPSDPESYNVNIEGLTPEELREMDKMSEAIRLGTTPIVRELELLRQELPQMMEDASYRGMKRALEENDKERDAAKAVDRPDDYRRRRKVIWLASKMALPSLIAIGCLVLAFYRLFADRTNWGFPVFLFVVMAVSAIIAWLIYFLWSITFIVCTLDSAGIERPDIRWLPLVAELNPELETSRITIRKRRKNQFLKLFGIDYWTIWLDTAALGESPDVKKLRGVAKGKEFLDTLTNFQQYILVG